MFEILEHYGGHLGESGRARLSVILLVFLGSGGLELASLPECFHGNKLDNGVGCGGVL